jgi:hypothetical protein
MRALPPTPSVDRRLLLASTLAASLATARPPARARAASSAPVDDAVAALLPPSFRPSGRVLIVGVGDDLTAALATSSEGDAVVLAPGAHVGRACLAAPVALLGGGPSTTCLTWTTTAPYESVVVVEAAGCVVGGVSLSHASPSVANNYALHLLPSAAGTVVTECAVMSTTGSGVGVEGEGAVIERCVLSDCASYGAAVFAEGAIVRDCVLTNNRRGGVLVRGASAVVQGSGGRSGVSVAGGGRAVVDGVEVV